MGFLQIRVGAEVRNVYSSHCLVSVDKKLETQGLREICVEFKYLPEEDRAKSYFTCIFANVKDQD